LNEDSLMDSTTKPLIQSIMNRLSQAKLRADETILSIITNLQLALEEASSTEKNENSSNGSSDSSIYDTTALVNEILKDNSDSPKLL
jgi:hypothetical protein